MTKVGLALLLAVLLCSAALPPATADVEKDCQAVIANNLSECLAFATGKEDTPTDKCCTSVNEVKDKDAKCLCYAVQLANSSETFKNAGVQVRRILSLSSDCGITGASISDCPKLLNISAGDPLNALYNGSIAVNSSPTDGPGTAPKNESGFGFRNQIGYARIFIVSVASAVFWSFF